MFEDMPMMGMDILTERAQAVAKLAEVAGALEDADSLEYQSVVLYLDFITQETIAGYMEAKEEAERHRSNAQVFSTGPKEVHQVFVYIILFGLTMGALAYILEELREENDDD